jgi:aconitate hydratase
VIDRQTLSPPHADGRNVKLEKGGNIKPLPVFGEMPASLEGPTLLKTGDNVSTDEIMPAGARVLPFRSNVPAISQFVFIQVDETYPERVLPYQKSGHFIVGGKNYGQGSSREHAAIAPRYLGVTAVLVKSFARIHRANLPNFGIVPLTFKSEADYDTIDQEDVLVFPKIREEIQKGTDVTVENKTKGKTFTVEHNMTPREIAHILEGGVIGHFKKKGG